MPNILFASNSISHFPGSYISGSSWAYDGNRVPYAIACPNETVCASPLIPLSQTNETWFHFKMGSTLWYVNDDDPVIELVNSIGNRVVQLTFHDRTTEGYHLRSQMDGFSFTNVRYIPMPNNQSRTYDIKVSFDGLSFEVSVYMNELLLEQQIYPVSNYDPPRYMWLGGQIGNFSAINQYSEIIVADGDTRNARLDLLRPVAVGAYGNWDGPVASLSDDDPTTGMTTLSPNQSQSTVLTPYTGASNVSNVVQVTQTVRGINSPENLQHLIRMSGVDYLTPNFAIPTSKEYQTTDWRLNPATSAPWDAADLASAEFGFRSIA